MPKKCLVCGTKANTVCDRSFHFFPKDEVTRQQWVKSLRLTFQPNFKTSCVCSVHFGEKCFPDEFIQERRRRRRLLTGSVPVLKKNECVLSPDVLKVSSDVQCSNNAAYSNNSRKDAINGVKVLSKDEINSDYSLRSTLWLDKDSCTFQSTNNSHHSDNSNSSICVKYEKVECESDDVNLFTHESETCNYYSTSQSYNSDNLVDSSSLKIEKVESKGSTNFCANGSGTPILFDDSSKERKLCPGDSAIKRVKFLHDNEVKYLSRSDFISNESWEKFLQYQAYSRSKLNAAYNQNSR
ncbi:uncharacterized protein LOC106637978 [Copidosoma floridanum]|uniref:uncharacterized protein LOC106637978 n=1 Tax=Copidosoma floridanum TaxID=29053 RepID=UPI0006C9C516|nr:uncharacterized protein LOC106637978 [Copidosoma floridanum]